MSDLTDVTDMESDNTEYEADEVEEVEEPERHPIRINQITQKLVTDDKLSIFELAHVLCTRVEQLEQGSKIFVNPSGLDRADQIAMAELRARKIPLAVRRQIEVKAGVVFMEDLPIKNATIPGYGL